MKARNLLISLALSLGLALALLWLLGSELRVTRAADLTVCPAGPPTCGYASVQEAVDAASDGDVIKVAAGTYTGVSTREGVAQVVYINKSVTIQGGYTTANWDTPDPEANPTILDAQGQGRVVHIAGEISPTLEGLHITGGDATGLGGGPWNYEGSGGGMYVVSATATIRNCAIYNNIASRESWGGGGGVYLWASPSTLTDNTIYNNTAGMSTTLGLSGEGGGLALSESDVVLTSNIIRDNMATSAAAPGLGGGLYMEVCTPTLTSNIVQGNTASLGGTGLGGGVFVGFYSNAQLVNTVLIGNVSGASTSSIGAGIATEYSSPRLLHTTLHDNTGGDGSGIHAFSGSTVALFNTILVSQTVGITVTRDSIAILNGVLWYANPGGNTGGTGTITVKNDLTGDPAFAADGYHLRENSPAIDAGIDADVTTDIDGQARPQGAGYDLGADERADWYIYLPVVLRQYP